MIHTANSLPRVCQLLVPLFALTLLAQTSNAQLERTLTGHTGPVYSAAYSPDGSQLASGSQDYTIRIWNAETGAPIRTLTGHKWDVLSVAYSPDGSQLASGSGDYTIRIWNAETGAPIRTLTGHAEGVWSVAYSPDSSQLASGSFDNTVRIWNAKTGAPIRTLTGHTDWVRSVEYSPDGTQIATGSDDDTIRIWNAKTGAFIRTLTGHTDSVRSVAYSPDSSQLATGSDDNAIRIWNAKTGALIRMLTGHTDGVRSVEYSPNGAQIASGSSDNTIRIWNAETGAPIRTLTGHTNSVLFVAYSPDSSQLASGSWNETIRIWNAEKDAPIRTLTGHTDFVRSVAYSPDGSQLASGSSDNTIRIWNAETGAQIRTLTGHTDYVRSVAYSPDSSRLVSGSDDNTIRIWNAETGAQIRTLTGHTNVVLSAAYSPDGSQIASGSADKTTRIWNAETGAPIRTFTGHTNVVLSAAYSPDGSQIASGSVDNTIRIWSAETGAPIRTLAGHTDNVLSVAYSPDGSQIASGSRDRTIRVWSAETGALIRTFPANTVISVAYSPDGSQIAGGYWDNTIRIWNAPTTPVTAAISGPSSSVRSAFFEVSITFSEAVEGFEASDINVTNGSVANLAGSGASYTATIEPASEGTVTVSVPANAAGNNRASKVYTVNYDDPLLERTLKGHTRWITSVAYSPDGTRLASGSGDNTIRIWNAETGEHIRTLTGHKDAVRSVAFSRSQLASSSDGNKTVWIWNAETGEHIRTLAGHTANVRSAAYSPDGSQLASGGFDNTIRIWNAKTGAPIRTLKGHTDDVRSVAYSPDSSQIASGSVNGAIRIWSAKTGALIRTLTGHIGSVFSTAYSPDGTQLASGGSDVIRIWRLKDAPTLDTTFTIALKRGLNLIHVPVKDVRLSKVSDLYNTLGGSSDVQYILSYVPSAAGSGRFAAYVGVPGSLSDTALSDQTAVIVSMRTAKNVQFTGGLLNDTVTLTEGINLIGVPRAEAVEKASGVAPNAAAVLVLTRDSLGNALFSLVVPNTPSDAAAVGGQGYIVVASADDSISFTGKAWADPEDPAPATAAATDAVKFAPTSAPVLLVEGLFAREDTLEPVNGLQVTIRNLRTGESVVNTAGLTAGGGRFVMPMIALRGGRYEEGDALEASAVDPSGTFGGWTPVRAVVGKNEIAAGRIDIGRQLLSAVPSKTAFLPNYPNPFNPETWIPFELADSSRVTITIYNAAGQTVRVLELGQLPAGSYKSRAKAAHWDGRNSLGEPAASGIYYARIEAGSFTALRRMVVLK